MASDLRIRSLRVSIAVRPSLIEKPSQIATVIGAASPASTTSLRSRGEMRSQKSLARSVTADMATSHALCDDGELELLAVLDVRARASRDLLEARDALERVLQEVELL